MMPQRQQSADRHLRRGGCVRSCRAAGSRYAGLHCSADPSSFPSQPDEVTGHSVICLRWSFCWNERPYEYRIQEESDCAWISDYRGSRSYPDIAVRNFISIISHLAWILFTQSLTINYLCAIQFHIHRHRIVEVNFVCDPYRGIYKNGREQIQHDERDLHVASGRTSRLCCPEPAARQVRTQLACRGRRVSTSRLFDASSSVLICRIADLPI